MNDTIAAVSTAKGTGAIAIVRLSGPDAFDILEKIYSGNISVKNMVERKCYNGTIIDSTRSYSVDNVIILKFQSPCSYTGQHIIEIHCHGGAFVVQHILRLLILNGAKPAEPGEFTKRAFLNGKIDLLQAESIADTIHAQSESSLKLSQHQLHGDLSKELSAIKETLIKQCSLLEIELDFSDEDIKLADYSTISDQMDILKNRLKSLLDTFTYGKLVKEGVKLVISGKPNAGKSSLMNTLLQQDRAIVTDIPGTTRDTIEEALDIRGFIFYITDTAGLHRSETIQSKMPESSVPMK
ncbi:MAG: tRNA uridine-5-carboxymethylaminomethyl(34) synthesis GTPase MnmE [candidate division KSB1 bacterium]|nr:tRNA uridine-5-carboxymethylaminomethyl(34) synthesis GTPase MnmE [candidate division KSB1 bacterium]